MSQRILMEKRHHCAYLTINRPEVHNALDPEGWEELGIALAEVRDDPEIRVAIVTGAGDKAFCAGADLRETIPRILDGRLDLGAFDSAMLKRVPFWKPLIAAVNGHCLAGGMEFLQATDIRVAAEHATFGLPEPRWGIVPAGGSLVRLVRQIPYCRAMEILLTGSTLTAQEALAIGLINKVVPQEQLMDEAERYARAIVANGPLAVQMCKEAVLRLLSLPYEEALGWEAIVTRPVFASRDAREGVRAFAEKRRPEFLGQ